MTYQEHCALMSEAQTQFPALKNWWLEQGEDGGKKIWNAWVKVFKDVPYAVADKALQRMLTDKHAQVFGDRWDQFPAKLISLFAQPARKVSRGGPKCEFCWGDGIIEVGVTFPASTIDGNPLRTFLQNGETLYGPTGAACPCSVGQAKNSQRGDLALATFDRKKMRPFKQSVGDHADLMEVLERDERASMRQSTMAFESGIDPSGLDLR